MDLRDYFSSLPWGTRDEFARKAGTKKDYIYQLTCRTERSRRKPSVQLARRIHTASGGMVSLASLRPDIWG